MALVDLAQVLETVPPLLRHAPIAGVTDAQRAELAKKNQERIAKIKAESDATVAAGRSNSDSAVLSSIINTKWS